MKILPPFSLSQNKKGFTLIELLVAISIIAIVFGIIISSAQAIQKQGRDAQRKADLSSIQSALQQYYADQNQYPNTLSFGAGSSITSGSKNYLSPVPQDPLNGINSLMKYCYQPWINVPDKNYQDVATNVCNIGNQCQYYGLFANLETLPPGNIDINGSKGVCSNYNDVVSPTLFEQ